MVVSFRLEAYDAGGRYFLLITSAAPRLHSRGLRSTTKLDLSRQVTMKFASRIALSCDMRCSDSTPDCSAQNPTKFTLNLRTLTDLTTGRNLLNTEKIMFTVNEHGHIRVCLTALIRILIFTVGR